MKNKRTSTKLGLKSISSLAIEMIHKGETGGTIKLSDSNAPYIVGVKNVEKLNWNFWQNKLGSCKNLLMASLENEDFTKYDTLGFWLDYNTDLMYFDFGIRFENLNDALKVGKLLGELAIWDNKNNCEIIVK